MIRTLCGILSTMMMMMSDFDRAGARVTLARRYFGYSMNLSRGEMRRRCPSAVPVGLAVVENYRFVVNARGVGTITRAEGAKVYGLLWTLSPTDERELDLFEGIPFGLYRKRSVRAAMESGEVCSAFAYVAADERR